MVGAWHSPRPVKNLVMWYLSTRPKARPPTSMAAGPILERWIRTEFSLRNPCPPVPVPTGGGADRCNLIFEIDPKRGCIFLRILIF